jgi:hypothetical protein
LRRVKVTRRVIRGRGRAGLPISPKSCSVLLSPFSSFK